MKQNYFDIKNTLYKIGCKEIAFNLWGLYGGDFDLLSKGEIKEITKNLNKATTKEKKLLKNYINQWCDTFRCSSLYIK